MSSTAAMASNPASESTIDEGTSDSKRAGGGLSPITLSTAIASGTGASSDRGVARRPSKKMPRMWNQ